MIFGRNKHGVCPACKRPLPKVGTYASITTGDLRHFCSKECWGKRDHGMNIAAARALLAVQEKTR